MPPERIRWGTESFRHFVAENLIYGGNPLPRAALAVVFPPNDVPQCPPDLFGGMFDRFPVGFGFQGCDDALVLAVVIRPVEAVPFLCLLVPLVRFHGGE
jgi:hypothetical protein